MFPCICESFCRKQETIYAAGHITCLNFKVAGLGPEIIYFQGAPFEFPFTYISDNGRILMNTAQQRLAEDRIRSLELVANGKELKLRGTDGVRAVWTLKE